MRRRGCWIGGRFRPGWEQSPGWADRPGGHTHEGAVPVDGDCLPRAGETWREAARDAWKAGREQRTTEPATTEFDPTARMRYLRGVWSLAGRDPATSQTSSGDPAMNPDPLDLESPARAPGDPSAISPPPDAGPTEDIPAPRHITEGPGTRIGPYKLLQAIGEGGMGVVYMAVQERPIRRRVALKVIKAGMDTDQVVARFEAERQALALMDHSNIARVLDAGATESGRPFFVMELVHGIPITEYCDQARLTPRERLELFVPVCQAIQHAHQKGIIHRDLKPSNVLVTLRDG